MAALTAGLLGAGRLGLAWRQSLAFSQWQTELLSSDRAMLRAALAQTARFGDDGWASVAALVGDTTPETAVAAGTFLVKQLPAWRHLEAAERQRRLRIVAHTLAHAQPAEVPAALYWSRTLATRMGDEVAQDRGAVAAEILANCHAVLRRTGGAEKLAARRASHTDAPRDWWDDLPAAAAELPLPLLGEAAADPAARDDAPQARRGDEFAHRAQPQLVPAEAPQPLTAAPDAAPLRLRNPPQRGDRPSSRSASARVLAHDDVAVVPADAAPPVDAATAPAGEPSSESQTWFRGAEGLRPFAAQHAPDSLAAAAAVDGLRRAGWSDFEIELGRQATAPQPALRRRLAEMLPRLSGTDPRQWLVWLSYDEDAEVRGTAVTWMASTGEPTMLGRVRQLAETDPDETVRRLAQRATAK